MVKQEYLIIIIELVIMMEVY